MQSSGDCNVFGTISKTVSNTIKHLSNINGGSANIDLDSLESLNAEPLDNLIAVFIIWFIVFFVLLVVVGLLVVVLLNYKDNSNSHYNYDSKDGEYYSDYYDEEEDDDEEYDSEYSHAHVKSDDVEKQLSSL